LSADVLFSDDHSRCQRKGSDAAALAKNAAMKKVPGGAAGKALAGAAGAASKAK
jgi:hypothetical protein